MKANTTEQLERTIMTYQQEVMRLSLELKAAKEQLLSHEYWTRDVILHHNIPCGPEDDPFAQIARFILQTKNEDAPCSYCGARDESNCICGPIQKP